MKKEGLEKIYRHAFVGSERQKPKQQADSRSKPTLLAARGKIRCPQCMQMTELGQFAILKGHGKKPAMACIPVCAPGAVQATTDEVIEFLRNHQPEPQDTPSLRTHTTEA